MHRERKKMCYKNQYIRLLAMSERIIIQTHSKTDYERPPFYSKMVIDGSK